MARSVVDFLQIDPPWHEDPGELVQIFACPKGPILSPLVGTGSVETPAVSSVARRTSSPYPRGLVIVAID